MVNKKINDYLIPQVKVRTLAIQKVYTTKNKKGRLRNAALFSKSYGK
jgi:hypothetical protein